MVGRKNECQVHGLVVRDVATRLAASTGIDVQGPTLGLLMKRLLLEFLGPGMFICLAAGDCAGKESGCLGYYRI